MQPAQVHALPSFLLSRQCPKTIPLHGNSTHLETSPEDGRNFLDLLGLLLNSKRVSRRFGKKL